MIHPQVSSAYEAAVQQLRERGVLDFTPAELTREANQVLKRWNAAKEKDKAREHSEATIYRATSNEPLPSDPIQFPDGVVD